MKVCVVETQELSVTPDHLNDPQTPKSSLKVPRSNETPYSIALPPLPASMPDAATASFTMRSVETLVTAIGPSANMEQRQQPAAASPAPSSSTTAPAAPTLPQPLFDRIVSQQWSSLTKSDELTPYLPLLALHVDRAINQSVSAADALSDASNAALLRLTAASKRFGDISAYTNCGIAALWTQTASSSSATPSTAPPPEEWEELGAAERLMLVMQELRRLHDEMNALSAPTLVSSVFNAPYSAHVNLILPLCLLHCTDFLSLAELAAILLRLSPPCAELLVTCVRNLPDRWEEMLSAVLEETACEWVEWASALSATPTIAPLLAAVSVTLHMLSQLSPRLARRVRGNWESLMSQLIPANSSAASLLTARTTAAQLPPSVSFLAETALSLTVYFVKDTIGFLSSQFYPFAASQSQPESSTISHLILPYLAVHTSTPAPPAGKEVKSKADDSQQASGAGTGVGGNRAPASRDSPAKPALIRSLSATQPTSTAHSASSPSSAQSKISSLPPAPSSSITPVPQLCRRKLSQSLHQLLVQRKSLHTGPSTLASVSTAQALLENTVECVTVVRLWTALVSVSGWQLETADATNLLLLISPAPSEEAAYMNDGGELSAVVLCFLCLCRPVSLATQLGTLWSMAHASIRQTAIAGITSSAGASSVAAETIDLLLSIYLAFCRRRGTNTLLPTLLHSALALPSNLQLLPSTDWSSVIAALQHEFGRYATLNSLLFTALGRGSSVVLHLQCVHWLLVNGSVERSLAVRCGGWLYGLLPGEKQVVAAVLLSPLYWSLVELLALTDVESEVASQLVDGRLWTERELRLLLHIPLSTSLVPPVSSSPASSFSSSSAIYAAHHWLTSFTSSSFRSALPSMLVGVYHISYYDLLCHNSQRDGIVGLNARSPSNAYPSTLLLTLPVPLISRLVMQHGGELGVGDGVRHQWAAVVARGKERGEDVGWAVALPSLSALPPLPPAAEMTGISVNAFAALCIDVARRANEVASALCWLYGLAHHQLIDTTEWMASLSTSPCCLHYVDSLVDVLLPTLTHSSTVNLNVLSYFVPLCQLFVDVLGVTFAFALTRRLLPADRSTLSLFALLADPTVLLSCSSVWWTSTRLLPLLTLCVSELLLTSRTYYRSLQSHYLAHTTTATAQAATDKPKFNALTQPQSHLTYFPHTAPPLAPKSLSAASITSPSIESDLSSVMPGDERLNYKRFPYLRSDEQREAVVGGYHSRWHRVMNKGRLALSAGGGEVDGLGTEESVWACVSVCAEQRIVQHLVAVVEAMRHEEDVSVSDETAEQVAVVGADWEELRELLQSHPTLASEWTSFVRRLSPSPPTTVVLDACRALSSFLLSLFTTSQLLPRLLLYRCTVPDQLWPLLIQLQPALANHVFPHVLALLSSSEPHRSLHALHLIACITSDGGVKQRWKPRLGDVLAKLLERLSGRPAGGSAEEERRGERKRKGKKRKGGADETVRWAVNGGTSATGTTAGGEAGVLDAATSEWVRSGTVVLLLLAREYTRHSNALLTVVKLAAGREAHGVESGLGNGAISVKVKAEESKDH